MNGVNKVFLMTIMILLTASGGAQANIWFSEFKCDVYVTPVPTVEETVYVFQAMYHDSTGEPIQYFSPPTNITGSKAGKEGEVNGNIAVRSARDETGKTHLVWMSNQWTYEWEVYYSLLDLDGNIVVPAWRVSDYDYDNSAYPSITIDSNGDAHIVWMDERNGEWEIYYSKVHPDTLAGQAQDLTTPDVAISAIDGFASGRWCDPDDEWEVVAVSQTGNPIVNVHTNFPEHPHIVVDPSDTVHVVWSDKRNGYWKIYYQSQSINPNPVVFINDRLVSSGAFPVDEQNPCIAVGPRVTDYPLDWGIHIAWQMDAFGEWQVWYGKWHGSNMQSIIPISAIENADTYHSTAPAIAVDDSDMAHIAFMDERDVDPGHGDPFYPERNDIHIDGNWEIYVTVLNTAGINVIRHYRHPKRESDLSSSYHPSCDSAWMEQWGDPVYGYYTGPGSCQNRRDAPSMFPRISTQGDFFDGTSKLVWQDIRNYNWDIYFEEISNWCSSPIPDVRITTYDGPDKFPEVSVTQTEHRDIQWQRLMPTGNRWDIWDSRWGGRGQFEEHVTVHITGPGRQPLCYYMYQVDHSDTTAQDGILYCWVRPEPFPEYTEYYFSAQNYLGHTTETEPRPLPTEMVGVETEAPSQPCEFSLGQNSPNPFNPITTIRYQIPKASGVSLIIYDLLGREVRTVVDEIQPAGSYSIQWDGRNHEDQEVASGIYFCRLRAGEHEMTKRMLLLR